MRLSPLFCAALVAGSMLTPAAFARQTAAGLPAGQSIEGGAPVAGVCVLSREAVLVNSNLGKATDGRLRQLAQQIESQLDTTRKPLDADIQAFRAKAASLNDDERNRQEQALGQRMQQFQQQAAMRNRQLEATRAKAMANIGQAVQPVITSAYNAHRCGLLLDRNAVLGGNMANDLTEEVVKGLDAKASTANFNLEPMPAAAP